MPEHTFTNNLLHHLLEQMRTAVLCITEELTIVYANSAAETLFYVSQVRLINSPLMAFFPAQTKHQKPDNKNKPSQNNHLKSATNIDADEFAALVKRAISYHQGFTLRNVELAPHHLRMQAHHVDIMVTPLSLPQQPSSGTDLPAYLMLELSPQDRQTQIAHEVLLNQQHAVTRQMIRGVAHEIKNPLAGIRGAAQLLQRSIDHSQSPEVREYTDVIINESDRIKELANSMLGSHKLLNLQPANIHEPLEHVLKLIAGQFDNIRIKRDYDSSLPDIIIDADKLIQVFLNISLNAAQALSEHHTEDATLTFKTRIKHNTTINGTLYRQLIAISLIDNGPGIPEKIQKTLFYPMVSGRAKGTGLGLSIAHDIVQQHDGMLSYTSESGNTVFQVTLPFKPLSTTETNTTQNKPNKTKSPRSKT